MKSVFSLTLSPLVLVVMAACGSSSVLGSGGSCTQHASSDFSSCEDFVGAGFTSSSIQSDCTMNHGTYSSSACPTAGALGNCVISNGTPAQVRITYYAGDAGNSTSAEQTACTQEGGTWTAG